MHIIFGDAAEKIPDKYTLLELDTVKVGPQQRVQAFCVLTEVSLDELPQLESYKHTHAELIESYRTKNWESCDQAINLLLGKFNGEVDSFYQTMKSRVDRLRTQTLPNDWDWAIVPGRTE